MAEVVDAWDQVLSGDDNRDPVEFAERAREGILVMRNCLQNIRGCNSFMTMTINRCIDYTKASKGVKLVPKFETAVLRDEFDMPVNLMRNIQSDITVNLVPISANICTHIITDRQWLIENVLCLLSNAVKYSHKGTVEVSATLESADGSRTVLDEAYLRVEVQDTGVGLSDEAMASLFNPFKQAQRLAGGTGLGLFSLAKRVEALYGQYGVRRRDDGVQGSVFWFTIPYRPDEQSAMLNQFARHNSRSSDGCDGVTSSVKDNEVGPAVSTCHEGLRVLVVDDAPLIVKMTSMLLKRKGHILDSAVNGADALDKISDGYEKIRCGLHDAAAEVAEECVKTAPFDVVLMDLQMPVLDGIEAVRRLRALERDLLQSYSTHSDTGAPHEGKGGVIYHQLVIALSANSDDETRLSALEAGADAFMPKPFTFENFEATLRDILSLSAFD